MSSSVPVLPLSNKCIADILLGMLSDRFIGEECLFHFFVSIFFVGKKKMLTFAIDLRFYKDFFTNKDKTLIRL